MALCNICSAISIAALTKEVEDVPCWLAQPTDRSPCTGIMKHLDDARQLSDSAATCSFCALIQAAILQNCINQTTPAPGCPPPRDKVDLSGRLANSPIYLQLRRQLGRNSVGRIPKQRPHREHQILGKSIAAYVPTTNDGVLKGKIRLYALEGSAAAVSGDILCGPPLPSSNCPAAFQMARDWLDVCSRNHPSCRRTLSKHMLDETEHPILPTRVIDVAPSETSKDVRLIETNGMRGEYITLSHCWGSPERHPIITTLATLPQHLTVISWNRLPKTFQDAITVARELGLHYIWIDSLCIVQDDHSDWLRESKKMGMIYERAQLTIGACHAADSTGGCFFPRSPTHAAVQLPYWDAEGQQNGHLYATLLPGDYASISPESSRLSERAWATQEWLLSRRMLFYTKESMVWSCRTVTQRETRDSFHDTARNTRWKIIIEKYSSRKLTRPTDRLIALEGLICELHKRNNTLCVQGIWADTLADQLMWYSLKPAQREKNPLCLPSWTWASCCHGVRFQKIDRVKRICRYLRIEDEQTIHATGYVKIAPSMKPLTRNTVSRRQDSMMDSKIKESPDQRMTRILDDIESALLPLDLTYLFYSPEGDPLGWATLDEGDLPEQQIYCLAVSGNKDKKAENLEGRQRQPLREGSEFFEHWVLLLQRCGDAGRRGVYSRVGVGMIRAKSWLEGSEMQSVKII